MPQSVVQRIRQACGRRRDRKDQDHRRQLHGGLRRANATLQSRPDGGEIRPRHGCRHRTAAASAAGPVSNPGGPAFRPGDGRGHRDAQVRLRRLGRYRQHRRAPRGGRSAQSRARFCDDGEKAGKRLQLRWSTQDRHQGRPRAGGIFRKLLPLMMSRIFRSPSVADGHSREEGTPMSDMRRREFIALLGGAAAAWPLGARAQQTTPAVSLVYDATPSEATPFVAAFQRGLLEVGFVEGQNVAVEYRYAGSHYEQLPALVAEFVNRQIAVIVGNTPVALAARKATSTIPIVFLTGADPVKLGLVASFNRPGGNVTGVSFLGVATETKRLGLLRELLPKATGIGALADPNFLTTAG